ncbi:uncharacterized protein BCR38DRAFT_440273 [Pseudomassariella vexata]|uniref:Chromo domain-containing protein n=1 Tax=Pseudomassariella vexata TaxID=1141098 RepID=A0A1Y2DQI4_9PEZI|nr:uncharacterized protein BCR38DRAFT_440273 [Pseudomassariella vexata]ORY61467.1 hypothetical protein BCR38DRAFT_440273 [Pseudomassariella vexata]
MSQLLHSIANWAQSPKKSTSQSDDESPRGLKRKAKADPYDMDDDEDAAEKASSPSGKTPAMQRPRSRNTPEAPASSFKSRLIGGKIKRRSRPAKKLRPGSEEGEAAGADHLGLSPAKPASQPNGSDDNEALKSNTSLVPVADMGGSNLLVNNEAAEADTDLATANSVNASLDAPTDKPATMEDEAENEDDDQGKADELDEDVHEVKQLMRHRFDKNQTIEILVHWEGETEEEATWEPEDEIQRGAAETLYEYWNKLGGRSEVLFNNKDGEDAPNEVYYAFKILRHEKKKPGGFQFEVQWIGYPDTPGNTTMESETKLKSVALPLLEEYWESVGGRDQFLAKRGRAAKKARIE